MKNPTVLCLSFLALSLALPLSYVFAATPLTDEQALSLLVSKIEKDKLYDGWTSISCLSFVNEEKTTKYLDIGIHEKHGGACPGDPSTFPIVDRFRVNRLSENIQWFDAEDDLLPYVEALKWRGVKLK